MFSGVGLWGNGILLRCYRRVLSPTLSRPAKFKDVPSSVNGRPADSESVYPCSSQGEGTKVCRGGA